MKNKMQYIMAGAGITLFVILGALTLLLPRAQAGEAVTSTQPIQSNSSKVIPAVNQDKQNQETNDSTETKPYLTTATEMPAEEYLASLGTKDKPQTNMDIIIYTVSELARKQEEVFLGKPGWLHIKWQAIFPESQKGTSYHSVTTDENIPMETLVPEKPMFDSWYHIDKTGLYREALSLVLAPDDTIYQQSVLVDGAWINLTLKTLDTHLDQYRIPDAHTIAVSPASEVFEALERSQTWPGVSMEAYMENGQYIVIKEQHHDPIENVISMPEPVIGNKEIYYFDQKTGQLLSSELQSLLQSKTWLSSGEKTYLTVEFLPEMPVKTSRLFNDLMIDAREVK